MAQLDPQSNRIPSVPVKGDVIELDGKRYRVVSSAVGPFNSADTTRAVEGVRFLGVRPE